MAFLLTFSGGASATYKDAVRVARDSQLALSGATPLVIDGITLVDKDRVLLRGQTAPAQNGIYVCAIAGGAYTLTRALDANNDKEVLPNMLVPVAQGTANADKIFQLVSPNVAPIVLGTDALVFTDVLIGLANKADRDLANLTPTAINQLLKGLDGSAATPAYSFTASPSTGIFSSGPNELNASTNGVERVRVDASGNVGIGSQSPNSKLQIINSGSQVGLSVFSTSTNNTASFFNQGTTNYTLELNSAANSALTGASIGGYFARGTLSSRAQTLANDSLLSISASGHTGSGVAGISGAIVIGADENTGAAAYGGQIVLSTTPNSTPGGFPIPRLYVKNDGKINISGLTASELVATDASKNLQSLSTATYPSLTELSYVKGVSSAIQTQLNSKVSSVTGNAPISSSGGTTPTISISQSSAISDGYLSSIDWSTFNAKQNALTFGNLTEITSSVLTISGGTGSVIGSGTTIQVSQAGVATSGYLSSTDWNTFNNKQPAGNYANDTLNNLAAVTAINESLLFGVDNSKDIGADGASRPAGIHAASHVTAPTIRGRDNVSGAGQHDITVRGGNGITGNKDGGILTLAGGTPSGTGISGDILIKTGGVNRIDITGAGAINIPGLTASQIVVTDASKNLASLTRGDLTESVSSVLTITGGTANVLDGGITLEVKQSSAVQSGYLSNTDWSTFNNKQPTITGAASTITTANLTANRAVISNGSGKVDVSAVTDTELGYLSGVSSAVQTQINAKANQTPFVQTIVNLLDAATIAVNAASGNIFRVTLAGNRTLGNPAGASDGQMLSFEISQDGVGGRTLAFDTKYRFSADLPQPDLTSTASKLDRLLFQYNAAADKFDCIAVNKGF